MLLADRFISGPSPIEPSLEVEELAAQPSLASAVELAAARYDFRRHPYFLWLASPSIQLERFRASQVPFRFAVESFSQAIAAVLARTPRIEERLPVLDNLDEEHGRGNLLASHKATFLQYLRALGATDEDLAAGCPASVRAFNQSLLGFCLTEPGPAGAALLGAIEHLYVGVSAAIAHTIAEHEWCAPGSQRHYQTHERLDVAHSNDLFALAAPAWQEAGSRARAALGLALGAHYFWVLYRDLLPPA